MSTALEVRLREAESRATRAENIITAAAVMDEAGVAPRSARSHRLFHELVQLDGEQAMRQHLREAASAPTGEAARKRYTHAARELLAKENKALPGGRLPIRDAGDVEQAVFDFQGSKGCPEDKAWIIKRAKEVPGGTDALPTDWTASLQESVRLQELGVPTLDGGPLAPRPLRESTAAALSARGIPLRDDSAPASTQRQASGTFDGIPMLPA